MPSPRPLLGLLLVISVALARTDAAAAEPSEWKAGAAKVSITPGKPVWMAGYASRNGPSDGVLVDIFARALVLTDAENHRLAVVTLDLIEIPNQLRDLLLAVAKTRHGLKPEELLLNVSHTHGGPMVSSRTAADWGVEPAWAKRVDEYVAELAAKVDGLLGKAIAAQAPASVSWSHARCGFAMNRRLPTPDGFRLGPYPDGAVDHDVPLLRIESAEHKLIALMFGYACHNTSLSDTRKLNGDYAGFAQRALETDHPGTVALFLTGCGGDQDPAPRRHLEDAERNGIALAMAVEAALSAGPTALDASLATSLEFCPLPFAPLPSRAELEARAASGNGFVSRHARNILKEWPNPGDQPADYQYPVQVVILGGKLTLVALGGEPMVDYAIRIKKELADGGNPIWVAGYSNLVNAYIPTRKVLREGGYEGTEAVIYQSLPAPFKPEIEDRVMQAVHREYERARRKARGN